MKQMTIKKKVTLWYTGIIALVLGMVLVFMFYFVDKVGISATEEEVSAAVTGFSANFQFQDGTYYLSEDTQFFLISCINFLSEISYIYINNIRPSLIIIIPCILFNLLPRHHDILIPHQTF